MGAAALAVACVIVLAGQAELAAKPEELTRRIKPGTRVFVIDWTGAERAGTIAAVSAQGVELESAATGRILVPEASIARIERTDRLWNGFLIGSGVWAFLGAGWFKVDVALGVISFAGYSSFGAFIDWLKDGREVLYRAERRPTVSLAPLVGPRATGAAVRITF